MIVAVDPKVIPLGSTILVTFKKNEYKQYNGIYSAQDIGGEVKGKHIDIFLGDFHSTKEHYTVSDFGATQVKVVILNNRK